MLDQDWLKTFAPFGIIPEPNRWQPTGACVFVGQEKMVWCVTAGHVVRAGSGKAVGCLVSIGGNQTVVDLTDIYAKSAGLGWVFHDKFDLAAAPMPIPPGIDIRSVGFDRFLDEKDLLPSMTCLTAGQPYGIPGVAPDKPTPLILDGVIAGLDLPNHRVFISVPTFPGNSGGPIIALRSPWTTGGSVSVGLPTVLLAGIVTETVIVANNQPDKKHIPALHLGAGASTGAIKALLEGPEAQRMLGTVRSIAPKGISA